MSLRNWRRWAVAATVCLGVAEVTARVDDWIFSDVPLLATPDRALDLVVHDADGIRGRPNGAFKKWTLNRFGFRGPEIDEVASGPRLIVLGASETFGLFEGRDREFPAVLRQTLSGVEVVNAAVAGMNLPSQTAYWEKHVRRFRPDVVVLYPSPHFYLDDEAPRASTPDLERERHPRPWRSRFVERLVDTAKKTPLAKSLRVRLTVPSGDDLFRDVPPERLARFVADLERLGDAIADDGARVVLATHAFKCPSPPEAEDLAELEYFRVFFPKAAGEAFPAFDAAARQATLDLGKRRGWPTIDVAAELNGQRKRFGDPVHFNDEGAEQVAAVLARGLAPLFEGGR